MMYMCFHVACKDKLVVCFGWDSSRIVLKRVEIVHFVASNYDKINLTFSAM